MTATIEGPLAPVESPSQPLVAAPVTPRLRGVSTIVLTTVTALAVWLLLFELMLSGVSEARDQHVLYAKLRQSLALGTAPIGGSVAPGTPIALFSAAAIGLHDVVVVEGTSSAQLRQGPGHVRNTPLPGQPGAAVLFGRSASFGAPFRRIGSLRSGDVFNIVTGQGSFIYRVADVLRPGQRYFPAQGDGTIRLVSTEGTGIHSVWAPDRLVYVDAVLAKGEVQPAPGGRLTMVPGDEHAMRSDTSLLTTIVLWLQALLLVSLAIAWSLQRWGRAQTLLIGAPVIGAVVWGLTEAASTLLPNLV